MANVIVPSELLLSWAAGLVRAVCAPCPDEIGEPVRKTAMQIKTLVDRATAPKPRECTCIGHCRGRDGLSERYLCVVEQKRGKVPAPQSLKETSKSLKETNGD